MGLFKPDLYHSFAAGFGLGALMIAVHAGTQNWAGDLSATLAAILPF